jgi:plasmid stability protein
MKNITVTVDDETYRLARIRAAERDTSVSAMVREFLTDVANDGSQVEKFKREEEAIRSSIRSFRAGDRLSRDEVHSRDS